MVLSKTILTKYQIDSRESSMKDFLPSFWFCNTRRKRVMKQRITLLCSFVLKKLRFILHAGINCAFHKLPLPAGEGWAGGSKT